MDELAGFKLYLLKLGKRESTINTHVVNLKRIFVNAKPFTRENLDKYLLGLKEKGKKETYLNHLMDAVSMWSHYKNLPEFEHMPRFKEKESIKATMSDDEIEAFLNLKTTYGGPKTQENWDHWTLFWSIVAYTGMRVGEVANLTVDSVDFGREVFILEITKTNQPRFVPIPPNIREKIKKHVDRVEKGLLFPSLYHKTPIDNGTWNYAFNKRIRKLGIKRKYLTPYSLRHSFITRMLEEDVNLFKVQKIVGHKQIETTAHYTHLTTKDLIKTIVKHPLIRRSTDPRIIIRALVETIKSFNLEEDKRFSYRIKETENSISFNAEIK